jgi:hypothetical protein
MTTVSFSGMRETGLSQSAREKGLNMTKMGFRGTLGISSIIGMRVMGLLLMRKGSKFIKGSSRLANIPGKGLSIILTVKRNIRESSSWAGMRGKASKSTRIESLGTRATTERGYTTARESDSTSSLILSVKGITKMVNW